MLRRVSATARPETLYGTARWAYQPALDGVRAFAVVAVLVFHARPDWLPGGFLGVDAFFVLSGFLITGLLLAEKRRTGRIQLAPFWGRRARRLLPALLIVVLTVVAVSRVLLPAAELVALRWDALAALGYVANWRMIFRGGDYFAATAPPSPLQHFWSLGIEEQFYLVWPLLVVAALRMRDARAAVLSLCGVGIAASAVACALLYHPDVDPGRAYYGTDARAGALLLGCAVATLLDGRRIRPSRWLAAAAVPAAGVLAWAWVNAQGAAGWLYRGGLTGLAAAVAVVLAYLVCSPAGWGARVLSLPPLAWLGRISYGLYLWHFPLFQWLTADRTGLSGVGLFVAKCSAALVAATACYYLVELPVRRVFTVRPGRRRVPTWRSLTPVTAAMLVGAGLVLVGVTAVPGQPAGASPAAALAGNAPLAAGASAAPSGGSAAQAGSGGAPIARAGRRPGALPRITFLGDSVAWTVGSYLPAHPGLAVGNRAIQGCGIARLPDIRYIGTPHTNYPGCDKWDARWRDTVAGDDPDVAVILLNRWELMDRLLNGRYQHVGDPEFDKYLTTELTLAIQIAASTHGRVVLLTAAYTHRAERPDGSLWPEDTPARVDAWNKLLATVAAAVPAHPTILDLNKVVCPKGTYTADLNGLKIRSDGLHFTPDGVKQVIAPWLLPQLTRLATTR
jgi:peptidoglycan/LPS O-acetylase OafA/YrhL